MFWKGYNGEKSGGRGRGGEDSSRMKFQNFFFFAKTFFDPLRLPFSPSLINKKFFFFCKFWVVFTYEWMIRKQTNKQTDKRVFILKRKLVCFRKRRRVKEIKRLFGSVLRLWRWSENKPENGHQRFFF